MTAADAAAGAVGSFGLPAGRSPALTPPGPQAADGAAGDGIGGRRWAVFDTSTMEGFEQGMAVFRACSTSFSAQQLEPAQLPGLQDLVTASSLLAFGWLMRR